VSRRDAFGPAKRSLGQNFLVDANLQYKIVDALGAGPNDDVLEIGPGRGALTRHLIGTVRRLVLVELDDDLAGALEARYGSRDDVEVVHGDVLEVSVRRAFDVWSRVRVVGNIPYNITSPIIFRLLEWPRPRDVVLMVQEEVADRIVASVGTKAYGALSVGVRAVAIAEKLFKVGRGAFRPVPGVDSAVIRLTPRSPVADFDEERLRTLVRAAFQWRRKQLRKILRDHPDLRVGADRAEAILEAEGLDPAVRPERLSPEAFVSLSEALPTD
jgi:16S rRNA (adenine1518-N6/adenine1519-N6)-dimethyltransferase